MTSAQTTTATTAQAGHQTHGGDLATAALRAAGIEVLFTLSGAHIFPVYDGCQRAGIRILDVRHEATAGFAAEGLAKLTGSPQIAAVTAGPGVTNVTSPFATAAMTGSPLVVLGGRAPLAGWGRGALQELDHVPLMAPIAKWSGTATTTSEIGTLLAEALSSAGSPHRGPTFLDIPTDVFAARASAPDPVFRPLAGAVADPEEVAKAASLLATAQRPAVMAGGDVWWGRAWEQLRAAAENLRLPVFSNGMGRGCLPADHELALSRTRNLLQDADVVVVVGTPLDFRLSYGDFGNAAVVHVADAPEVSARHVDLAAAPSGDLAGVLGAFADYTGPRGDHEPWIERLRMEEESRRASEEALLTSDADPIHPARVYGELRRVLDRDAVVIGDGGEFVQWAGRLVDSYLPGHWLDPGPYGCLGTGPGYAIAARIAHPDRQVVLCSGDGAFGFAGVDLDSLVRHHIPALIVVGNNGIWALEKHPMQRMYGYDVAAELQHGCRYDEVCRALGGAGETVSRPGDLKAAFERGLAADGPYVVNVLLDENAGYSLHSRAGRG